MAGSVVASATLVRNNRRMTLHLATTPQANDFLAEDPLGLLVGMLLDQQIPMEKAFTSPQVLAERMGPPTLDAQAIAEYDAEAFELLFRQVPALHRFPAAMAKRVQEMCRALLAQYDGDAERIWTTAADGAELVKRIAGLPGFGDQKARIFTALLGKQFDVTPKGWRQAAGNYGEAGSFRSVADVVDKDSLGKVRAFKKEQKAAARSTSE
ncbi:MAG: Fe-S cluster assembly protein HesB [Actinomycetota bacterium]|nr:Fe-S cluster assembly protein HesB [Actinomycetota bacterium]MDQ2956110.1 Fe-S cluster assembly protein HesB [Actinomycetota bacterium]